MLAVARLGRVAQRFACRRNKSLFNPAKNSCRNGSDLAPYRDAVQPVVNVRWYMSTAVAYFATVWVGVNMYHDPDAWLLGEYPMIYPKDFTDEELGIPPDEEDIYPPGYVPLKDRQ
ncbi:NADH dehydrogenase [ubiquinone] 1 beta subcomplex subunit 2 [Mactra antiquata]